MPFRSSILAGLQLVGVGFFGAAIPEAVRVLDDKTNLPLGHALSIATAVFFVGMWISRKLTHIEDQISTLETRMASLRCQRGDCPWKATGTETETP